MSRRTTYLVAFCLIIFSRGAIRVDTGEPHDSTTEVKISSRSQDDQNIPPHDNVDTFTDRPLDIQMRPQEPYPHVLEEFDNNDDVGLVPPTPTVGDLHGLGTDDSGPTAAAPLDTKDMDSTSQVVDYPAKASVINAVPKTDLTLSDLDKTTDQEASPTAVIDGSRVGVNGDAVVSSEPDRASSPAKDGEPVKGMDFPAVNHILEEILPTQKIYDADRGSQQISSSKGSSYTLDVPVVTDALKSVQSGTLDDPTKSSVGLGEKVVEPQVKVEAVMPTQFSLEDEDGKTKVGDDVEFPTFDKWSMQYLAEQEKQKMKKKQEQAVNPANLQLQKKLRMNFAAKACGAKVVANNPEAENVNFVLNKNPDEYMLSPCKAKKWFVVELCEPLQIHKVELGTTELFASQPKSFRIFSSQRFPTKEWMPLGKFDMTSERTIHSFSTQIIEEFVKFVRVEMLEHHGEEYYCPVTTFRVLGVDMASEDDDDNNNEIIDSNGDLVIADIEEDEVEESVNLFTSAKDAVVKLVKKVLFKEDQEDAAKEELVTIDNTTAKVEEKKGETVPCSEKSKAPVVDDVPTVQIPEAGIIFPPPDSEEPKQVPIVTKLADTEQLPMVTVDTPVIIKLDKDADTGPYNTPDTSFSPWNTYVQMMAYKHLQSSTCPVQLKPSTELDGTSKTGKTTHKKTESSTDHLTSLKKDNVEMQLEQSLVESSVPSQDASAEMDRSVNQKHDTLQNGEKEKFQKPQIPIAAKVFPTKGHQQEKYPTESSITSHLTSFTSLDVTVTRSENLEPSSLFGQDGVEEVATSLLTPDLHIQQSQVVEQGATNLAETIFLKVSPTPTLTSEDSMEVDEDILLEAPTAEQLADMKVEDNMSQLPFDADHNLGQDGSQIFEKNETDPQDTKATRPIDLVKVGVSSSSSKRDTTIMKLNNRIMALEQNVSMTKKYLEELSRAFKQQNEDMMKMVNKTEKRLSTYMSQSEEREFRQQTHVDVLEQKVLNLTLVVDAVQVQMNALGKELRGAQFLLAVFQVVLFLWLVITSYRGRGKSPLVYTDHQFLLDTMPTKPNLERSEKGNHQRRNSDIGIQSGAEPGNTTLKRQVSEANLASFGASKKQSLNDDTNLFLRDAAQVTKKRKKKKLKQPQLSLDAGSSLSATSNNGSVPAQSSSFSSYAGVLFGTENAYRPEECFCIRDPVSEVASEVKDNYNMNGVEGHLQGRARFDGPYVNPYPIGTFSRQGVLGARADVTIHNVLNSAVAVAPNFQIGIPLSGPVSVITTAPKLQTDIPLSRSGYVLTTAPDFISENFFSGSGSTITSPSHFNRVPLLGSEPSAGVGTTPSFHSNGHTSISDLPFSKSPLADTRTSSISLMASPEFKLPLHHRNKIRKLADSTFNNHQGCPGCKSVSARISEAEEFKRRRSTGFINPDVGGEFFLVENYMSENRFKFPRSPPSNTTFEPTISLRKNRDLYAFSSDFATNGSVIEEKCPLQESMKNTHPLSSTLYKGQPHYKSTSSLSSMSSSSQISTSQSLSQTSAFAPLHLSTTQASFMSAQNIPQSLSETSLKSLTGTSTGYRDTHRHTTYSSGHSTTQNLEPESIIPSGMKISFSVPIMDSQPCSQTRGKTFHHDGSTGHDKDLHQTLRRQESLPVNQLRSTRSFEKESPSHSRKGSFEDTKQLRKSSSGILQGPKVKKTSSNINKKSMTNKTSVSDNTNQPTTNRRAP